MMIRYDQDADILYLKFTEGENYEGEYLDKGIVINYDKSGNILSMEILSASKRFSLKDALSYTFEVVPSSP
ncbi:DUF2283 domain-containing protein [Candidatus Aerophobetes bacterium]|nr:DUF2283 domain-containing protein [Candidatus Aerophobetes bacterium]